MTKTTLYIAISLDGYIATKDGSVAWLDKYNDLGEDFGYTKFIDSVDTIIMGSTTYKQILTFGDYPYVGKKGFVFSNSLKNDSNVEVVSGSVNDFYSNLEKDVKNIWLVGGANLVAQFIHEGYIDEFIITVMPENLRDGIKLFGDDLDKIGLTKKSVKHFKTGVIQITYEKNN